MSSDMMLRRVKGRSPSYPAISLELAIQRAQELYEKERQHPTPVETVAHHWSYKSLNGPAAASLAALKKFGLVEDEGNGDARRARISNLAVAILVHPDEAERLRAVRTAALEPPIHQELWQLYGAGLPSDATLHWELTRDRGFTERGAAEFIKQYKATVAFANLDEHAGQPVQESAAPVATGGAPAIAATPASPDSTVGALPAASGSRRSFPIPLISGGTVVVEGDFPISERDWAQFMAVMTVMKPGLVSSTPVYDSEARHDELDQP